MTSTTLSARPLLDWEAQTIGAVTISPYPMSLVCIAAPNENTKALGTAVKKAFGTTLPEAGMSTINADASVRILSMGVNQYFVQFGYQDAPEAHVAKALGKAAYVTDQSDATVAFEVTGEDVLKMLERICAVDLDESVTPVNGVVRTSIEHSGATLVRVATDNFIMMSASSSAWSFVDMLCESARYINAR